MNRSSVAALVALVVLVFSTPDASAQPVGASPDGPTQLSMDAGPERRFPSIFGSASAFPSPSGTGYVGLTLYHPRLGVPANTSGIDLLDGDMAIGYTIGNPIDAVSANVELSITSLDGFANSGAVNLDLSRAIHVGDNSLTFLGVSASNLGAWGDAAAIPEAYSIYVSHLAAIPLGSGELPLQLTLGYGDRTTLETDGITVGDGAFWGIGLGLTENVSASLAGTRTELHVGLGISVPQLPSWSFSVGAYDVLDNVDSRQYALGISRAF